jgi:hypothetical protein
MPLVQPVSALRVSVAAPRIPYLATGWCLTMNVPLSAEVPPTSTFARTSKRLEAERGARLEARRILDSLVDLVIEAWADGHLDAVHRPSCRDYWVKLGYSTFNRYCRNEFGIRARDAQQLYAAAECLARHRAAARGQ